MPGATAGARAKMCRQEQIAFHPQHRRLGILSGAIGKREQQRSVEGGAGEMRRRRAKGAEMDGTVVAQED